MKAAAFAYARAESAAHAVELLAGAGGAVGEAKVLAGGQSLGPLLNLRLAEPARLVDVRRCPDLRGVAEEHDAVVYGAATTHAEIEDGAVPDATPGWLRAAAAAIAYRAVRNRGTLGGSLAHADPAADWPVVLLALGAEVIGRGPAGVRALALADFLLGPFQSALAPDEVLTAVRVPRPSPAARWGCCKLSVKAGEFARAMAAVLDDPGHPGGGRRTAVVGAIERRPLVLAGEAAVPASRADAEERIAEHLPDLSPAARRLHAVALARAAGSLAARPA